MAERIKKMDQGRTDRSGERIRERMRVKAALEPGFVPLSLWMDDCETKYRESGRQAVVRILRDHGCCDHVVLPLPAVPAEDGKVLFLAERLVKTLLWLRGGWEITVAGSGALYAALRDAYREGGARAFDAGFMGRTYRHPFEVRWEEDPERLKVYRDRAENVGGHLEGCRIGFDAGGSDRKVSAVVDGKAVYSEEVVWNPKEESDPQYHFRGILEAFRSAAAHLPRVDAVGVSSAGIFIDNEPARDSSLFRKIPPELYETEVAPIYLNAARALGEDIPLTVANDGDVTALAGAMSLGEGNVLGIAMGTSQAGGFVDGAFRLRGWLTELAFVPVDANRFSARDEWSGDVGTGVQYFSQDGVIRLAKKAGIALEEGSSPAQRLTQVQSLMAAGDPRARQVFETIGVCLGYALAWYARFIEIRHVLVLGRVTSGEGGSVLLDKAREVLDREYPALAARIRLHLPDEKIRRVGQSIAAASLPQGRG